MFPKLSTSTCLLKERINADIKHEDHVRKVVARSNNKVYRPWKNKYCPKNAHTPFGDYPEHMVNSPLPKAQRNPIWQKSYASTDNIFVSPIGSGSGGAPYSLKVSQSQHLCCPPKCGASNKRLIAPTHFRKLYDRGDLPIKLVHKYQNEILWTLTPDRLDYKYFLPIFFDGLREKMNPYRF